MMRHKMKDYTNYGHVIANAIREGIITRPKYCSKCGNGGRISGHHPDYSNPLEVVWLCGTCHLQEHWEIDYPREQRDWGSRATVSIAGKKHYLQRLKNEPYLTVGLLLETGIIDKHEYFADHLNWEEILKTLSYREREIIRLRYGIGDGYTYTLEEVGRIFKVTRERVRCIEAKAIRRIRHEYNKS